jgi:hypothetical protein
MIERGLQVDIVLSSPGLPFLPRLLPAASTMSSRVTTTPPSSNFQSIFNAALKTYEKQTKRDLLSHPLASQLQTCDSLSSILAVLQGQVDDVDQARKRDERLTRWLGPTVNVLLAFSDTLGEGVSLVSLKVISFCDNALTAKRQVFSPAKVIFAGAGVLLQVCIFLDISFNQGLTPELLRRLRMLLLPTRLSLTSLNVSRTFSNAWRPIPRFDQARR